MDNLLSFFFEWLAKLDKRAKKCIDLHGEYVEYIPSLVAVACLLPGRAKALSAPLVIILYYLEFRTFFSHFPNCKLGCVLNSRYYFSLSENLRNIIFLEQVVLPI